MGQANIGHLRPRDVARYQPNNKRDNDDDDDDDDDDDNDDDDDSRVLFIRPSLQISTITCSLI